MKNLHVFTVGVLEGWTLLGLGGVGARSVDQARLCGEVVCLHFTVNAQIVTIFNLIK